MTDSESKEISDLVAINRQVLLLARSLASRPYAEIVTGMTRQQLNKLGKMSLPEVEELASSMRISLVNFRINEVEFDRLLSLKGEHRTDYSMAIGTNKVRSCAPC